MWQHFGSFHPGGFYGAFHSGHFGSTSASLFFNLLFFGLFFFFVFFVCLLLVLLVLRFLGFFLLEFYIFFIVAVLVLFFTGIPIPGISWVLPHKVLRCWIRMWPQGVRQNVLGRVSHSFGSTDPGHFWELRILELLAALHFWLGFLGFFF